MIQIKPVNVSIRHAITIADHVMEKYGSRIESGEALNLDGLVGVTHYSLTKSKAGNVFLKVWRD